jgi:hypothetical protein
MCPSYNDEFGVVFLNESQAIVRNIEQTILSRLRQSDSVWIGCQSPPKDLVIEMEDSRCKVAAVESEDPRCKCLLQGVEIEVEDPRYKSLRYSAAIEMDDPRCKSMLSNAAMQMEDPRCQSMRYR